MFCIRTALCQNRIASSLIRDHRSDLILTEYFEFHNVFPPNSSTRSLSLSLFYHSKELPIGLRLMPFSLLIARSLLFFCILRFHSCRFVYHFSLAAVSAAILVHLFVPSHTEYGPVAISCLPTHANTQGTLAQIRAQTSNIRMELKHIHSHTHANSV